MQLIKTINNKPKIMHQVIKVGIMGGAGYTGGELLRLLIHHPQVSINFVHSKSNAGKPVYAVHQDLIGSANPRPHQEATQGG
jgi:N-acetyl-gamma-glutamyl-phosphate reductase